MRNSVDRNNPFDPNSPGLDMSQLQELLRQQAQRRRLYENISILGCGYVGSTIADYWQSQGHFVTGTTTSQRRVNLLSETLSRVLLMRGDDSKAVQSLLKGQDTVLISVAPTGSQMANEATYETTYLTTAKNILQVVDQSPTVKQLIYLSSCSVYGDRQGEWVDESSPIFPSNPRSQVLQEAEQIISQAANENRKVCIFRLGGIYGPGRELVGMLGGLAGMTLPGKGDRIINWIHRDDIVGAIEFARLNELDGVYNLVDDSQLTMREQVEQVCLQYGLPPAQWNPLQGSLQRKSLRVSNQKLKAAGYQLLRPHLFV